MLTQESNDQLQNHL